MGLIGLALFFGASAQGDGVAAEPPVQAESQEPGVSEQDIPSAEHCQALWDEYWEKRYCGVPCTPPDC